MRLQIFTRKSLPQNGHPHRYTKYCGVSTWITLEQVGHDTLREPTVKFTKGLGGAEGLPSEISRPDLERSEGETAKDFLISTFSTGLSCVADPSAFPLGVGTSPSQIESSSEESERFFLLCPGLEVSRNSGHRLLSAFIRFFVYLARFIHSFFNL